MPQRMASGENGNECLNNKVKNEYSQKYTF